MRELELLIFKKNAFILFNDIIHQGYICHLPIMVLFDLIKRDTTRRPRIMKINKGTTQSEKF